MLSKATVGDIMFTFFRPIWTVTLVVCITSCGAVADQKRKERRDTLRSTPISETEAKCLSGGKDERHDCFFVGSVYAGLILNYKASEVESDLEKSIKFNTIACDRGGPSYACFNAAEAAHKLALEKRERRDVFFNPPARVPNLLKKACTRESSGKRDAACHAANAHALQWGVDMGDQYVDVSQKYRRAFDGEPIILKPAF